MLKWNNNNTITNDNIKRPKKITGTRFASVLGLNKWTTEFQVWCEITRSYNLPFEENQYTRAGKTIEPKVIEYLKSFYYGADAIVTPEDIYGADPFQKTWGDFYPEEPIFGGMWDALLVDPDTKEIQAIIEIKTTKRAEDWVGGDAPIFQSMQGALYAHLKDCPKVIMTGTILEDEDYINPENFVVNSSNTFIDEFSLTDRFPNLAKSITRAETWWKDHVETGISPKYNEKRDAEYLDPLRTHYVPITEDNISELLDKIDDLQDKVDAFKVTENELKQAKDQLKEYMMDKFRDGDTKVETESKKYTYTLSKSERSSVDSRKLKKDGLYDQYCRTSTVYTLRNTERE